MNKRILLIVTAVVVTACGRPDAPHIVPADAVYTNADIYTVGPVAGWTGAMAVTDGKITALGSAEDMQKFVGEDTAVHDLGGRMVMPGIHDTHIHPSLAGEMQQLQCHFLSFDLNEVLDALRACIADTPEGEWVRGGQWYDVLFQQSDKLPREILDEIAPDHPVFLMDWSWHNGWVNSKALEMFGIDSDTPNPQGGVVAKDEATGEPTGILGDAAAYSMMRQLPAYSLDERMAALEWSLKLISQHGVTTIKEAIVTTSMAETYREMSRQGRLPMRIKTNLSWKSAFANSHEDEVGLIATRSDYVTDDIDTGFAKIMLDGVPIPPVFTAAMLEPYEPNELYPDGWRGKLIFEPEELNPDVIDLDSKGLSVKIHATGDWSVRAALDAFEAAREANGDSGVIHEISHAELIHPDDIPRFAELNVAAEMCPILWHPVPGLTWDVWLGDRKPWPIKNLVEAGALVTYGSDWSVVPTPNPWPGIEAMVTRADPSGNMEGDLWPEQAIDLETTIRIFTLNSAIANRAGDHSGSLEVGKDADFIVLDRNIFEVPITDVGDTQVLLSVVGGKEIINEL